MDFKSRRARGRDIRSDLCAMVTLSDSRDSANAGRATEPLRARAPDSRRQTGSCGIWGLSCPVGNAVVGGFVGQPTVFCATEIAIPPEFGNIGQGLKDGLPYQPWA